ncbi:hypothetical protein Nepgr_028961 [Nepenthes gracilis]|uniref:Protein SCAR n=1 Tax=Nepenthes gracilis TaxID=150966 RepID=A0AAD3Y2V5_NEPGR|nr:hypothetical protein Nepgr_028961 [Nepenthes gracilis]
MPLVRFEVKNEYGLGVVELYDGAADREDPKAVLDGVAVAGLVGILRQLGDLAEFAAEVFHGLQEQVISTSTRSRKLMTRVRHVEAALPRLEKAILSQTSHIHFAYTPGSEWHARIINEQNHFITTDMPCFIMDSYEECREPPHLQWLDKFDTGGPGSCLKRYSDPTFFRRATATNVQNTEKCHRERKACKIKKRRSRTASKHFSHGERCFDARSRIQFSSPTDRGQLSPAQTVSTLDMPLRFDMGNQSDSLGSRDGMGFIECVLQQSTSVQPDEAKTMELCAGLDEQMTNALQSVSCDEQTALVCDDSPSISVQEKNLHGSCSITWDEKTELMEPAELNSVNDEVPDALTTSSEIQGHGLESVDIKSFRQGNSLCKGKNTPKLIFDGNQLDEIESETEYYVDALNTIESDSENEFYCQTKREVELYTNTMGALQDHTNNDQKLENVDDHPPESEAPFISDGRLEKWVFKHSHDSASSVLSANESLEHASSPCFLPICELTQNPDDSLSSVCLVNEQLPQSTQSSSMLRLAGIESCSHADNADGSGLKSAVCESASSGSQVTYMQAPMIGINNDTCLASPEISAQSPSIGPLMFWTNGNLLGLEPSKPPDLNSGSHDSAISGNDNANGISHQNPIPKSDELAGKLDSSTHFKSDNITLNSKKCKDVIPISGTSQLPHSGLDKKLGEILEVFHHSRENSLSNASVMLSEAKHPVAAFVKTASNGAIHLCEEQSTLSSGLGRGLQINGFQRTGCLGYDEKPKINSPMKSGDFKNGKFQPLCHPFPEANLKEQLESPRNSPPPSPPLEHMKISFQPINGFETSKLKLRYPDGIDDHEGTIDTFPSFQLVSQPNILQHVTGSDSDNDTFCRSNMSHDLLSHLCDADSEVWESGDTSESEDRMLYDGFCRISSAQSIPGSPEHEGGAQGSEQDDCRSRETLVNMGVVCSQSGSLFDLPILDTMSQFPYEKGKRYNPNELKSSLHHQQPNPHPPPLPPPQWMVSKLESDAAEGRINAISDGCIQLSDPKQSMNVISQQSKCATSKVLNGTWDAATMTMRNKQLDEQKLNGETESKKDANGKRPDDREDFLHQIRMKSLNLRRTEPARPACAPGPTTNFRVTAILEKANAIRQAVGSDDGEDDDNWSDS